LYSLLAMLALSCPALAEVPGKPSSTFVGREDLPRAGLATPVMPAQAKADPVLDKKEIGAKQGQDPYEAYIRLDPPGPDRLFGSRDTEKELEERMRQERRDSAGPAGSDPIAFPTAPPLSTESYQTRQFDPTVCLVEPNYIVYRRLYFEEENAERYGWSIGLLQPTISTLVFFKDALLFPHNFASFPCRRFETNAGQCQPGDPVPYLWYPPEVTATGLLAEVGTVALLFASVP